MQKSKVAIVRCENYNTENVYQSLKKGINLIGGILNFVKKGEKILLKPNILAGREPEKAVSTHPAVFEAILKILKENDINITYGDSPGFDTPIAGAKKSQIFDIAEKYSVSMADFDNGEVINFKEGRYTNQFSIAKGVLNSNGIISLPKMKSHQLTRITGSVKNQFGCITGFNKALFHLKIPNSTNFCKMLIDLNIYLKPRLYIMDGIVAMEGNGPASGNPIPMNVLIISNDPIAVDSVFCKIVDINPEFIPTNVIGREWGLGTYNFDEIELLGDNIDDFINKNFDIPKKPIKDSTLFHFLKPIKNQVLKRPVIINDKCLKCGICVKACPLSERAIFFKDKNKTTPPVYDYKKCIRCFCCQEVCPHKAIFVKTPLLGKIFGIS